MDKMDIVEATKQKLDSAPEALSMSALARRIGVGKATLSAYFTSGSGLRFNKFLNMLDELGLDYIDGQLVDRKVNEDGQG